jgi:hypothetical protein
MRPYYYYPSYPTWGWGFGVVGVGGHFHGGDHDHHHGRHRGGRAFYSVGVSSGFYDPFYYWPPYYGPPYYGPAYYMADDETDPVYWEWKGESDVRLHLVYQRGTNANMFTDPFTFHRKKM